MNLLVGRNVPATLSPKRIIRGPRLLHLPFRTTSKYKTEVVLEGEGEGTARSGQSWGGSCRGGPGRGTRGAEPSIGRSTLQFYKNCCGVESRPQERSAVGTAMKASTATRPFLGPRVWNSAHKSPVKDLCGGTTRQPSTRPWGERLSRTNDFIQRNLAVCSRVFPRL